MSDGFTYVIKCTSGRNKENCPYILQNAISACAACSGAAFIRRNREDFERLRQTIEEYTFDRNGSNLKLTSSIGICEISDFDPEKIDTLIGFADMALYQAKRTGRNKIIYFYPENTLSKTQEN